MIWWTKIDVRVIQASNILRFSYLWTCINIWINIVVILVGRAVRLKSLEVGLVCHYPTVAILHIIIKVTVSGAIIV